MSIAQELQLQIEKVKAELEGKLAGDVKSLLGKTELKVEAMVQLDFNTIQVRLVEEQKQQGRIKITKTVFERTENDKGVVRSIGVNNTTILIDNNNSVVGSICETAVYDYQLIAMIFNIIEEFYKKNQSVQNEEKSEEKEVTKAVS